MENKAAGVLACGRASSSIAKVSGFSGSFHVGREHGWGKTLFLAQVRGDDMIEAGILDGDLAVVRAQEEVDDGDIVVVSVGFEAMIRRIFLDDAGGALLTAENKKEKNLEAARGDWGLHGKVVAIHRKLDLSSRQKVLRRNPETKLSGESNSSNTPG